MANGSGITGYFFVGAQQVSNGRAVQWYDQMNERSIREASYWQSTDAPVAYGNAPFIKGQFYTDDYSVWHEQMSFTSPLDVYVEAIHAAKSERFGT